MSPRFVASDRTWLTSLVMTNGLYPWLENGDELYEVPPVKFN